ncbi:MAG: hypothetical protein R3270_06745 [Gammaproteobacteria bacterium]|nr:hypothetical protein [Gammaproteobacteria bacterium]
MKKRSKVLFISLFILLLVSALGKWLVFEFVLDEDDSGRQRIEATGDPSQH